MTCLIQCICWSELFSKISTPLIIILISGSLGHVCPMPLDCASILTFLHTDFFWCGILSLKKPHPCPLVVSLFVFFLSLRLQYFFLSLNLNIWVPRGWWLDHHLLKPPKNTKGWLSHSKDCEIGQPIPRGCSGGKSHLEMHLEGLFGHSQRPLGWSSHTKTHPKPPISKPF